MSKTNTKTQTTTPANPAVTNAYTGLVNSAQQTASQPLQLYNGPLVAGLTGAQNTDISNLQTAANGSAPGFAAAQNYVNQSATPITPAAYSAGAVDQYMSPYTQDVVNATQKQFDQQNATQESGLQGSSAAQGALGGDRSAILQAQLAGQQETAQAPVIAGLYNSGFNQAQGEFNTQQGVGLSAAQANNASSANAGVMTAANTAAAQNSALTGNEAALSADTLQQNVNQENLNVPYEQYLQQQAYPYQNEDFLSSILGGASTGSGSTTNSTSTTPFNIGSFIANGAAALGGAKNGGRIGLAAGGVPDVSMGYVPQQAQPQVRSMQSPQMTDEAPSPSTSSGGGLNLHGLLTGAKDVGDWFGGSGMSEAGKGAGALGLLGLAAGGRTRLADGGTGDNEDYLGEVLASLGNGQSPTDPAPPGLAAAAPAGATMLSAADTPPEWRGQATNFAPPAAPAVPGDSKAAPPDAAPAGLSAASAPPPESPVWDDGTPVATDAPVSGTGLAAAGALRPMFNIPANDPNIWHSLAAGLGGFLTHGLGAGINAGLKDYDDQRDPHPVVDHSGASIMVTTRGADGSEQALDTGIPTGLALNARAMNDYRMSNLEMNRDTRTANTQERAQAASAATAERAQAAAEAAADRANALKVAMINASAGRYGVPVPGMGQGPDGKPVQGAYLVNGKTGQLDFHPGVVLTPSSSFRSLPAMVAAKFQQEHPDATLEEAENFATEYAGRTAGERTLGNTSARIGLGRAELENLIPQALQASAALPRTQYPTANAVLQAYQSGTGDPRVRDLALALQGVKSAYAQVLTRGGAPTEGARAQTDELFNTRDPQAVLETAMARIRTEGAAVGAAPAIVRAQLENRPSVPVTHITPTPTAIAFLKQHPENRSQFDTKYGAGASAHILGN